VSTAAVVGLAELGFATVVPLLPLYLREHFGAGVTLIGFVVATFAAVDTSLKTVWGGVADRVGRRAVITGGLLVASAAPLLMTLIRVPVWFVPLRLIDGSGSATVWPSASAAVAECTGTGRRAAGMGMLNMFFLAGLALGPTVGLFVSAAFGDYRAGFYVSAMLLLTAAAAASAVFRRDTRPSHAAAVDESSAPGGAGRLLSPSAILAAVRSSPVLPSMLLVSFVQLFGVGLLTPILVIYAHEVVHLNDRTLGIVFLVIVLAVAAASVPGGRLADRVGRPRVVTWGMAMSAAGMWLLPAARGGNFVLLAGAAVLLGGSYAISSPAWLALMSEAAPPGRTGLVMGASETAQGAGLVIGPVLGGFFYDHVGPAAPFVASAVLLTAGTLLAAVTLRRRGAGRPER
jgi:MFS transporter, DHA1 family, multidrug resistance protein